MRLSVSLPRFSSLALAVLALAGSPVSARAQGSSSTPSDDSLEVWRLPAPALAARCRDALARARLSADSIVAAPGQGAAFPRLQAAEQANAELLRATIMPRSLQVLSTDAAVRDSSVACDQRLTAFSTAWSADSRLYALARRAQAELGDSGGTPADRRLARLYVEAGRLAGAGLDSAARARAVRLLQRHADLERAFSLALAADSSRIRIPLRDTLGLEPQLRARLTRDGDSLVVAVNASTSPPFMQTQRDRDARHRYRVAYESRGGQANVALLDSALAVRDTLARLLGFPNFGAYQLSTRMAGSPDRVLALLGRLRAPLRRKAMEEVAMLLPLARQDGIAGPLQGWDVPYYSERLRQSRYALARTALQQYFPVDHVLPEVMRLYSELLGVRFQAVTPAGGWAPEVTRYSVVDAATGQALGRLYFDLYPRPNKYQHFADFSVAPNARRPDGSRQLPWTAIVGNWPLPAPGRPALLTHSEVVVFFHEFGHAMAALLDQSPYPTTSNFRLDFVEAPSQMLENWVWQPAILRRISRHVTTGEPLPDSLIGRMVTLKHLFDGITWSGEVFRSTYDMMLHTAPARVDPTRTWFDLFPQVMPFPPADGTLPEASFGHLMAGYEAGYYGYLWSRLYAQDLFSRFEREGIMDARAGRAYRDQILAPSGTEEADVLMRRFLGRELSDAAFYRELGLAGDPAPRAP